MKISNQPHLYLKNQNHSTINKLKIILHETEREEQKKMIFGNKKEEVGNVLKSTINLVSDSSIKRYDKISNSIETWVKCSQLEMEMIQNSVGELNQSSNMDKLKKQDFIEKLHIYRESYLSVLFLNDKNMKSLYYLILTLFLWLLLWVIINDLSITGQLIDTQFWKEMFKGILTIGLYWFYLFCYSFMIIPYVKLIEKSSKFNGKINYILYFTIYLIYICSHFVIVYILVFDNDNFNLPCRTIIACESTRHVLKIHGYFREKILNGLREYHPEFANWSPLILLTKNSKNEENLISDIKIYSTISEMKMFLYYLFCPSLIYRDSYPRIIRYRWHLISAHVTNFIFCIIFYYILMRFIWEPYFNYSKIKDYYSLPHFVYDCLRFSIPGICFLVVGFFLLLHSWLNLWSELLRHGDRRFYEDWWNCTNFAEYYRKWNMVVHEWLYYYVYNDVLRFSLGRLNRFHAKLAVFSLSVIVHELIIWIALGFFFPVLSFFFGGPGIIFTYIKTTQKQFNIAFWCKLLIGTGIILVLYLREFKLRETFSHIGLVEQWHEWIPRTFLMFTTTYRDIIQNSRFY